MNCKKGCLIVKFLPCKRPNFQQDDLTIDEESDKLPWVKQLSLPNNGECSKGLAVKQTCFLKYWESDKDFAIFGQWEQQDHCHMFLEQLSGNACLEMLNEVNVCDVKALVFVIVQNSKKLCCH